MPTPDWESLSDFEQFALLVHAPDSEYRLMGMIAAYCDESADVRDPAVYAVSGLLGRAADWYGLGIRWRKMLVKHHLETVGFHMGPCEAGRHAPYDVPRDVRDTMQRDFIGVINATKLWGYASAIETDTEFPKIKALIESQPGFDHRVVVKPYYTAFQHTLAWLSEAVDNGGIPRSECIAFVFDQQKEHEGIAKKLYDDLRSDEAVPFRHRLGHLGFDSRLNQVQLQAADVFAYESMRYVREVVVRKGSPRWQYTLLASVRHPHEMGYAILDVP